MIPLLRGRSYMRGVRTGTASPAGSLPECFEERRGIMVRTLALTMAVSSLLLIADASAQNTQVQMPQPGPPSPAPVTPACNDFRHNPDGSWSPLHAVTVGDVTLSPKAAFLPGSQEGGVDLAALLNQQCAH
jgi:hypothetical protein